ncbi:DegT/DnrJ/EryC1/StrS family aminotransferase [Aeromonas dhakensis]
MLICLYKLSDIDERTAMLEHLKKKGIMAVFHYIPLHSAIAGKDFGRFHGEDNYTTKESECLIRLPLYYGMTRAEIEAVKIGIYEFFA